MTGDAAQQVFELGDVVRVRNEAHLSEVVRPTHRQPDCEPADVPDLEICCVPLVLVRTPVGSGVLRWIEIRDVSRVEDTAERTDGGSKAPD